MSAVQLPDQQTFLTNANIVQEQSHQTEQSLVSGKCTRTLQHKEPLVEKTRQMSILQPGQAWEGSWKKCEEKRIKNKCLK